MTTFPSPALPPPIPRPLYQPLEPQQLLPSTASAPATLGRMAAAASSSDNQTPPPLRWHYGDLDDRNFQMHGHSLLLVIVVFSLLLFLMLLCLYARWACRYRRMVITVSSSSAIGADGAGMDDSSGGVYMVAVGLDREAIDGLPVVLFQVAEESGGRKEETMVRCSICLSTFREGDKVKVLPGCGHMFHPECVDEWLRSQPTCPLCRSTLGGKVADADAVADADQEQQLGEDAV